MKTEIKSLAQLIDAIERLEIPLEKIIEDKCGVQWDRSANKFFDMNIDELDVIGVVIEIEEKFELNVWDYVVDELFDTKPDSLVAGRRRNDVLRDIGI
jgi:hypothetical protein